VRDAVQGKTLQCIVGTEGEAASAEEIGQKIEFKFMLREPGRFNLTFVLMPSCWIGCDASVPVDLTVQRQTVAEKSGKVQRRGGHGKPVALDGSDDVRLRFVLSSLPLFILSI
jgi:hypothetical protein